MQGARRQGEPRFHPFGQLGGCLQCLLGKVGLLGEGGTQPLMVMVRVSCIGGGGLGRDTKSKYLLRRGGEEFNSKAWGH